MYHIAFYIVLLAPCTVCISSISFPVALICAKLSLFKHTSLCFDNCNINFDLWKEVFDALTNPSNA